MTWVRWGWLFVGVAVLAGIVATALFASAAMNACPPIYGDEFDGSGLDASRWQATYKSGGAERQAYVPEALRVAGGILRITAEPRLGQERPYTSGIITTQGKFSQQYGYFEIRAQVPQGQGLWPAFWLLHTGPLPWTEIDVFEILGNDTHTMYMSNHWRDTANAHQYLTKPFTGPDFSSDFHTFGVNWTRDSLTWYIDGSARLQTRENIPAEPMFLLANLAVGGDWPGYPDATTLFPAYLDIDYIRVYAPGCRPGPFGLIGNWPG